MRKIPRVFVRTFRSVRTGEAGFSLIELLAAIAIAGILVTLSATAFRQFWLVRSLSSAQAEIATQLRRQQQRVVSETHPLVYGARFPQGADRSDFGLIRFNADANGDGNFGDYTCAETGRVNLPAGVLVQPGSATDFDDGVAGAEDIVDFCEAAAAGWNNDDFVFFFARGNATSGQVEVKQTALSGDRRRAVCVIELTARVATLPEREQC